MGVQGEEEKERERERRASCGTTNECRYNLHEIVACFSRCGTEDAEIFPHPSPHFFGKTGERSNVVSLKSGAGQNGTSYVSPAARNSFSSP